MLALCCDVGLDYRVVNKTPVKVKPMIIASCREYVCGHRRAECPVTWQFPYAWTSWKVLWPSSTV